MGFCGGFMKFIFVIFNLLLLLTGLVPFIFGIIAIANEDVLDKLIKMIPGTDNMKEIIDLNELIKSGATYFIVIGVIIAVIGFLGCFGACCKSKWMLYVYLVLLVLIFLAEIVVIIVAVAAPETFNAEASKVMKASLKDYKYDCNVTVRGFECKEHAISLAWNSMQYELKCCGANGYGDFKDGSAPNFVPRVGTAIAPVTCCKHDSTGKFNDTNIQIQIECVTIGNVESSYYDEGCFSALMHWMTSTAAVIGVMVAIGVLELILIVLTILQLRNISPHDRYKQR